MHQNATVWQRIGSANAPDLRPICARSAPDMRRICAGYAPRNAPPSGAPPRPEIIFCKRANGVYWGLIGSNRVSRFSGRAPKTGIFLKPGRRAVKQRDEMKTPARLSPAELLCLDGAVSPKEA